MTSHSTEPCGGELWLLRVKASCHVAAESGTDLAAKQNTSDSGVSWPKRPAEYSSSSFWRMVPFKGGGKPILGLRWAELPQAMLLPYRALGLHLRIWQALLVKLWSKCSAGPGISFPTILHKHLPQNKLEFSSLAMSGRSKHVTSWPIGEWHTGQGQVQLVPAWSASGACLQDFKA